MKILFESYSTVMQHDGGGVQMRIQSLMHELRKIGNVKVKLFDKWNDKLSDYDVLHIFKDSIEPSSLISYAKSKGVKVVVSSVIPQMNAFKIRTFLIINKLCFVNNTYSYLRRNLQVADKILPQTIKEAKFIANVYNINPKKMIVTPNGVNQNILDSYDKTAQKDIILCVGRFDRNKNQHALIEAVNHTDYELHLVGGEAIEDSSYYSYCQSLSKKNNRIFFHGWLPNKSRELLDLYKRARVVALVSHKEIFGNSLIEGGACGANLLATAVLPTEEWGFGDNCIKTRVATWDKIWPNLTKAFEMPLSPSMHNIVKAKFSWESIAKRHLEIYESIL